MAKKKKQKKTKPKKKSGSPAKKGEVKRWPIILFCIVIALIMAAYFWIYNQPFFDHINLPVVNGYAWAGSHLLNLFGQETFSQGSTISGSLFSMDVSKGCDALSPTFLFLATVLAFPMAFKWKIPALAISPFALAFLNIIRIVSLYLIGAYAPSWFEFAHIELWQAIFIIVCFLGWIYWLIWANKKKAAA